MTTQVTVVNNTNFPVNVCISAGFNLDWMNQLEPGQFKSLSKSGSLLGTLHAQYSAGPKTEFSINPFDVGTFAAGAALGVAGLWMTLVGIVLALPSGGTSLSLAAVGIVLGAAGLASGLASTIISVVSISASDWEESRANQRNVEMIYDPKYIIEGKVDLDRKEHGRIDVTSFNNLTIRRLSEEEFEQGKKKHGWIGALEPGSEFYREDPAERQPVGSIFLNKVKPPALPPEITDTPVRIYPSFSGIPAMTPVQWSLSSEENGPVLLGRRPGVRPQDEWIISFVEEKKIFNPKAAGFAVNSMASAYSIKHATSERYVCVSKDPTDLALQTKSIRDNSALFFIIQSGKGYAFVPIARQNVEPFQLPAIVNEKGKIERGTRVLVGEREGQTPGWARWAIDSLQVAWPDLAKHYLQPEELDELIPGCIHGGRDIPKYARTTVRIFPAVLRTGPLRYGQRRPVCWEARNRDGHWGVELGEWDASPERVKSGEWEIHVVRSYQGGAWEREGTRYSFYNPALGVHAEALLQGEGILPIATRGPGVRTMEANLVSTDEFAIFMDETGFLNFVPTMAWDYKGDHFGEEKTRRHVMFCSGVQNEATICTGKVHDHVTRSLSRWMVMGTNSSTAKEEHWAGAV